MFTWSWGSSRDPRFDGQRKLTELLSRVDEFYSTCGSDPPPPVAFSEAFVRRTAEIAKNATLLERTHSVQRAGGEEPAKPGSPAMGDLRVVLHPPAPIVRP